jgi:putative PIN family toxin of toxin-antitoxin system
LVDFNEVSSILSVDLVLEYRKVISSDEIMDKVEDKKLVLSKIVQRVIEKSIIVEPTTKLNIVKEDPDDNKVLECAKAGKVDLVITNDNHLLKLKEFEGIKIVTPQEFLELFSNIN